ncbi:MAG: hypothetical protein QXJ73_08995 [Candidatus Caldarchaeum sp.]
MHRLAYPSICPAAPTPRAVKQPVAAGAARKEVDDGEAGGS